MARYTLALALPARLTKASAAGLSGCLGQALLDLGAEVSQATRCQLVAHDAGQAGEPPMRMIFCWSRPAQAEGDVQVSVELISREPMGTGAPRTQAAIDRLIKGLGEQLGPLRVLSDSRNPTAQPAAIGASRAQQAND